MQTVNEIQNEFIENFNAIGDWMLQYEFLLQIGGELEPFPETKHDSGHLIPGCQSKVWLECAVENGKIHIRGDSEALIIKGMIAVAVMMFQDQPLQDVASADVVYIKDTELKNQISTDRFNGIHKVIAFIQNYASDHL